MKNLVVVSLILTAFVTLSAHAALPDLTGTYTGCADSSVLGTRQAVLVMVKMPTGFGPMDFRYTGGFYWRGTSSTIGADFFTDVRVDEPSARIFMAVEIKPLHDFGSIAKTVMANIQPDGSITGEFLSNSTGQNGEFHRAKFIMTKVNGDTIPALKCGAE